MYYRLPLLMFLYVTLPFYPVISKDPDKAVLKLRIVHHNDITYTLNGLKEDLKCIPSTKDCEGGIHQLYEMVMQLREESKGSDYHMIYLYAGNILGGSVFYTVAKSQPIIDVMNMLQPDVMCLGITDFHYGPNETLKLLTGIKPPIVASNVDFTTQEEMKDVKVPKSVILNVAGHKVAIVGYTDADVPHISNSHDILFYDEFDSVRDETKALRGQGIRVIIGLGSSRYEVNTRVASRAPLVDILVSGSPYFVQAKLWTTKTMNMDTKVYPLTVWKNARRIPILQVYGYSRYLGVTDMDLDILGTVIRFNGTLIKLAKPYKVNSDSKIRTMLDEYTKDIDYEKTIGRTSVIMNTDNFVCFYTECSFGNVMTDAMVDHVASKYVEKDKDKAKSKFWTDAPIAILEAGSLTNSIGHGGNVTQYHLYEAINYLETLRLITVSGRVLKAVLERNVIYRQLNRNFLQFSGLQVSYDYDRRPNSRVIKVKARCGQCHIPEYKRLNMSEQYRLVVPMVTLDVVLSLRILKEYATDIEVVDANLIDVMVEQFGRYKLLNPRLDRRIIILNRAEIFGRCNVVLVTVVVVYSIFNLLIV